VGSVQAGQLDLRAIARNAAHFPDQVGAVETAVELVLVSLCETADGAALEDARAKYRDAV
jgi:hypothetical protein